MRFRLNYKIIKINLKKEKDVIEMEIKVDQLHRQIVSIPIHISDQSSKHFIFEY